MTLKSKIFAFFLVISLGLVAPSTSSFASDVEDRGCCGCWTGFMTWLSHCCGRVGDVVDAIDDALDEVDERLEQFQGLVTRLDRRLGAFVTIAGLEENEHVIRIRAGIEMINGHIDLIQVLIGAADDIVEDAQDGISIQDVWTAVRSVRTSLGALHEANVINAGHLEGANARIADVEDRLDGIGAFWAMGQMLVENYQGFASRDDTFEDEDVEVVIHMGGHGGDDEIDDL